MLRFSDISNRPVVCKSDCSVLGTVRDAYFDENCKNIAYFVLFGEYSEMLLPFDAVAAFGDAVMVDDALALISSADVDRTLYLHDLPGKAVYTNAGKLKGTVTDVTFGTTGKVASLQTAETSCAPSSVRAFGDVLILKDNCGKRKTPRVSFPKASEDRTVTILNQAGPPAPNGDTTETASAYAGTAEGTINAATPAARTSVPRSDVIAEEAAEYVPVYIDSTAREIPVLFNQDDFVPHRIIADYNFLLGRTLQEDLRSYVGEKIASKGEKVTVDIVEKSRRHGKLIELTLNSK